ncbi:MAG: sodium/proline symporter [Bacteroidota bacterium]
MLAKYIILALYFLVLFLIGIVASRRIKGLTDFYAGGKKLGYWVVAFSARATGESGWLLLGVTGMGAMVGLSAFWVVVGELIGVGLAWWFMAKPFKRMTDDYDAITIPDYLAGRFPNGKKALRLIAAFTLTVFVTIYVSAQIDTTGKAFETFLDWDYFTGVFVGFAIVLVYTFSGGFVAVAWSDLFQGLIMLVGLVGLPLFVWWTLDGSLLAGLEAIDPSLVSIWGEGGLTFMNVITAIGLLSIGLGFLGSPQVFVRYISIKDEAEIEKGKWVAIVFTLLTDSAAVLIGMLGRYVFTEAGQSVEGILGNAAENVLPMMVDEFLPLALAGLYIAAVLAAIMSTIDSLLVVASSAITRDIYQQMLRPDRLGDPMTRFSRIVTLSIAIAALAIAMSVALLVPGRTVFWFVIFGWNGIAATFCPMIVLSLFWSRYNAAGAIASMLTGFVSVPLFKFVIPSLTGTELFFENLAELMPSFILSAIAGVVATVLSNTKQ